MTPPFSLRGGEGGGSRAALTPRVQNGAPSPALKPCPFCGGAAVETEAYHFNGAPSERFIRCRNVECDVMVETCLSPTDEEAIAAWNRRVGQDDLVAALLLVRGIIKDAAMEGFNYQYGNWADRLFASQAVTHAALAKIGAAESAQPSIERGEAENNHSENPK